MVVCVSVPAPLCWVRARVSLCVFCCQPFIGRFFVCLSGIIVGVCACVCVFHLSGCLSLCLVLLVSVDLLVLSSSTCTAGCHTHLLGRREEGSNFVGGCWRVWAYLVLV